MQSQTKVATTPHVVLAFTLLIAALGVFPHHLMFLFPLAASLTLAGLHPRARIVVAAVSAGMLVLGALMTIG